MVDLAIVVLIWGITGLISYNWFEVHWNDQADKVFDLKTEKPITVGQACMPGADRPTFGIGCACVAMGPLLLVVLGTALRRKDDQV